jgi:hypothetical protein
MSISSIQTPPTTAPPVQNPITQLTQRKLNDHDGDAYDVRMDQKAALSGNAPSKLLDVTA